ncbi:MAG: DHH family phosphoesterase [Oscillospiraceae bacterium]|nr:DHH family phosphoesterase [Oscillospiraceae bacterium]
MPKKEDIESSIGKTTVYVIIILILLTIICYLDTRLIMPSVIVFVCITLYSVWINDKNKTEVVKHIQELTLDTNQIIKNTMINAPFPLVIIKNNDDIIWKNTQYTKQFYGTDIKKSLSETLKEIKLEYENTNTVNVDKEMIVGGKIYKLLGQCVKLKGMRKSNKKNNTELYYISLYIIDNSEYIEISTKYEEQKTCIGIITIDNYEEILQRISVEEKPQVLASIEKAIYDWTTPTGGLVIKTERETYIYVFEQKYLKYLEENKFSLLDSIKEINIPGKAQLTVSISISNEGDSDYEKYESSLTGLDIALGRGGDQAVIRNDKQYKFYGGRTQEVEKRTKVKARIISQALKELIMDAENVVIMGHKNGDIDSIGSSLGLYRLVKTLNKPAYIVNSTYGLSLQNLIQELEKDEEYKEVIIDKAEAITLTNEKTLLIIVDTHRPSFTEIPELLEKTKNTVLIDHHRKGTEFIENPLLIFHEVYASSASELVAEILQYSEDVIELKEVEVEALYAGIILDTKNFTFKTGVRTFEVAAYLRKFGVDIIKVKKWFQSDLENYNIIADVIKQTEIVREIIGISVYKENNKDAIYICAKAADELLSISTITTSFVIGNTGEAVCISGRSIGDINVQVILEKLGGGGNITTAGTQVVGKTVEEVKTELLEKIEEYFSENV